MGVSATICRRQVTSLLIAVMLVLGFVASISAEDRKPLRILLTNDDGFDAAGIRAVYDVLIAAGHDVILIGPLSNQSGSGVRVTTSGVLGYKEHSPGIWSVDGSPADSVLVGVRHIMKGAELPDIVVSGANFGQNLAYGSSSGTVGAATMAMYMGIPAIAVSVGVDLSERNAAPVRFPSTREAFPRAAELTLTILDDLQKSARNGKELLPAHTILNVNYPAVSTHEFKGVRVTRAAKGGSGIRIDYEDTESSGQLAVNIGYNPPSNEGRSDTDVELFFDGYAVVTVLDGDWDAGKKMQEDVLRRLSNVANH